MVQGSQIGPLLFIIFVNDIVDLLEKPASLKLFADDIKLYSRIENSHNPITKTLEKISDWSRRWQMKLNPTKSTAMKLGKHRSDASYSIDDVILPEVQSMRDLGITYDSNLKFDTYIANITSRAVMPNMYGHYNCCNTA